MHYLLFYDVVEDYAERRNPLRQAHLDYANQAVARGELVLGGALANPVDGAVLLFRGTSPAVAESFAAADPYVLHGLVRSWRVREWTTVAGTDAEAPIVAPRAPGSAAR
ncbi:MAG: YciI-like protein [Gemmatimonadota bacterium]